LTDSNRKNEAQVFSAGLTKNKKRNLVVSSQANYAFREQPWSRLCAFTPQPFAILKITKELEITK